MIKILIYIFIFISTLDLDAIIGRNLSVLNFSLLAWVLFPLYIFSFLSVLIYVLSKEQLPYKMLLFGFLAVSVITITGSMAKGYPLLSILEESCFYIMPVTIYSVLSLTDIKRDFFIKLILYVTLAGGAVALLCAAGIINPGYSAGNLIRSAVVVDGGLGLLGLGITTFHMVYANENIKKSLNIAAFLSSLVIIATGQSRTRIVLALAVVLIVIATNIIKTNGINGRPFKVLAAFIIIAAMTAIFLPEPVSALFTTISDRFQMIGEDNATLYRTIERTQQMSIFEEEPLLGNGWGGLQTHMVIDIYGIAQKMGSHNMYSTILAMAGIIFFLAFTIWFIVIIRAEILRIYRDKDNYAKLSIVLMIVIGVLGWTSAGFGKPSQIIAIMLVYLSSRTSDWRQYEEDRCFDLSSSH